MSNLILLFLSLFLGFFFKRIKIFPENAHRVLNTFVINISLVSLSLYYIPKIDINFNLLIPVSIAWTNILLAILVFGLMGKKLGWNKALTGAVIMTTGFGNTSFMGIPVVQALFGESGIKTVMLVDQPGSFVALSTIGIGVVGYYSGELSSFKSILSKILKYPPFIAFIFALIINVLNLNFPYYVDDVFKILGATTIPLALVSVGSQLKWEKPGHFFKPIALGLFFKLLLFPLIIFALFFLALKKSGELVEISLIEAAMPPMITAAILATAYDLEPKFCNMMIAFGIPISFFTLGLWYWILQLT